MKDFLLNISDLTIKFPSAAGVHTVVDALSLSIPPKHTLALVGESGSGKTLTGLSILQLLPIQAEVSGNIYWKNQDLLKLNTTQIRALRGHKIAWIAQEPMSALNPSLRCGKQIEEVLKIHKIKVRGSYKKHILLLLEQVKLPDPERVYKSYPHQLSGGQLQRLVIAMALACGPELIIADEPTTALDVTVQKEIISLLKTLQEAQSLAIIFISHDLNLVAEIAHSVIVMREGKVVEKGSVFQIFKTPKTSYTKALLAAKPDPNKRLNRLPTQASLEDNTFKPTQITQTQRAAFHKKIYQAAPILEVGFLTKVYKSTARISKKRAFKVLKGVSFKLHEGETVGLVGESGCGKSTLARTLIGLEKAHSGFIKYRGKRVDVLSGAALRAFRSEVQLIFQDPFASLQPRMQVGRALVEAMKVHGIGQNQAHRTQKAQHLLEQVGLSPAFFSRYPHQLSGGQRQRIGIARALALQPKIIICDESVSALDISVQAQVLNLLNDLKDRFGFSYLFISHDLAVVKYMSDQLLVMQNGYFEEAGDADEIYAYPRSKYTKKLINAMPKGL